MAKYDTRIESLEHLAGRLIDAGATRAEWTKTQIVDALVVLTNVETFESLNRHRARNSEQIADALWALSTAFVEAPFEPSAATP